MTHMPSFSRLATHLDTCCSQSRMKRVLSGFPARSRDDIHFFKGESAQYRYRERGQGTPIVFVADPPVTLEFYDELLDLYASRFRVIVFEIPAMGFTVPRFGLDFTFPAINGAIIEFLESVVGPSAILAFSCVVGLGAVDIASRRPDLVSRLVLIQTPSWAEEIRWKKARDPKKILAKPFLGQIAMNFLKKGRAPAWFDLVLGNRGLCEPFGEMAQKTIADGAGWALASAFQRYLSEESPLLRPIDQPFLCLWGEKDGSHLQTDKQSSLQFGSNGSLVRYDDLGHFPELENVGRVHKDILHFIAT